MSERGAPGTHDYRTVASREIFDGRVVRLRVDTLTMPGGGTADREICGHDDAVAVIALDDDDRITLVRQYRHAVGERLWELPAGLCDVDGEEPLATARRELVEETGLEAEHWRPVIEMVPSPGFCTERVHVYLATGLREVERPEAEHEEADMEVARMPFAEAVDAVLDGRIVNGIAVAGILAARTVIDRS
ncbi:ADP-ribose pyrophosphatase [Dietzia kunjamensis]|uniref:NUDIX domain-containing protein n=1 Tax=Dietzia TaxID=37914 RepID=UPI000E728D8D|nr:MULTISPECIES: NUDIX hydrolase [Dietzia]MVZ89651.1 NUDIX domain-containing protein [Microbacter sp. ANSKLAB05]MBB1012950.1 NUDIX hydrolase [Dietzia kunjamensis]MCT1432321.1 NUDIX hydrolase [Dietzia maris]MCT1519739.1 NUDIX hydrolase [Dietzia maris]RKE66263.1 ADP-ribose pyrophosphatase [Dietzia kunjamensis]